MLKCCNILYLGDRMRSWFLTLMGVGSLLIGVINLGISLTNRHPTELTCKDYLEKGTSAYWVILKNCNVHYLEYVHTYRPVAEPTDTPPDDTWYATVNISK